MFARSVFSILLLLLYFVGAKNSFAQDQVVFTITSVPEYTKASDSIYLSGTFNDWALADSNYRFRRLPDETYRLVMRLAKLKGFDFKINRGDWDKAEGNDVGGYLANHKFNYSDSIFEYRLEVKSWQDLHKTYFPSTIIKVISIPESTPTDAKIFVSGSFNGWNCNDPEYELKKAPDGTYFTEVNSGMRNFDYKFTRGNWETVEARWDGGVKSNREFIAISGKATTIITKIYAWEDLSQRLLVWKIVFAFFFIQIMLVIYFLLRTKQPMYFTWVLLIFALGYFIRFIDSDYEVASSFPKLGLISSWFISFFAAPVYFWLNYKFGTKKRFEWTYILPFIPFFALLYFWQFPVLEFNLLSIANDISKLNFAMYSYAALINLFFMYRGQKLLRDFEVKISSFNRKFYWGLKNMIIITSGLLVLALLALLLPADIKLVNDWYENISWTALGVLLLHLQLSALRETDILLEEPKSVEVKSNLPEKQRNHLKDKLTALMESKKLYANPKLSLAELAKQLGTNTFYVSKLLNDGFEMSFTDYVNSYRIKAFIEEVNNAPGEQTFLYVALKMGFNSKSSFNRAFKKVTGKTPSDYFGRED